MKLKTALLATLGAAFSVCVAVVPVHAQSLQSFQDTSPWFEGLDDWLNDLTNIRAEDFTYAVGIGMGTTPDYSGGDKYQTVALPLFQIRYKDTLTVDPLGVRLRVWRNGSWRLRVVAGLSENRSAKNGTIVSRLPGVARGMNTGATLEGRIAGPVAFRLNVRKEVAGGHNGWSVNPSIGVVLRDKAQTYSVIPEVSLAWSDGNYMDSFYSVTPQGAVASGLPQFKAGGGFRELALRLTASYQFNEDWSMLTRIQGARLLSDAKRSPIVRQTGDSFQGLVGFGFLYTF